MFDADLGRLLGKKGRGMSTITEESPRPHMGVPGSLPAVGRMDHESKKFASEIKTKTAPELRDLKRRQEAVLANRKLIATLPDKGEKVRAKLKEIEALLAKRESESSTTSALLANFSNLTIAGERITCPEELEWKLGGPLIVKGASQEVPKVKEEEAPSKEEEELKVLVEGAVPPKGTSDGGGFQDWHSARVARKDVEVGAKFSTEANRFAPFSSLKHESLPASELAGITGLKQSTSADRQKERASRPRPKEAMPLPKDPTKYKNAKAVMVSLEESLRMQREAAEKIKEAQLANALERLREKSGAAPSGAAIASELAAASQETATRHMMAYREPKEDSDDEDEDDENNVLEE